MNHFTLLFLMLICLCVAVGGRAQAQDDGIDAKVYQRFFVDWKNGILDPQVREAIRAATVGKPPGEPIVVYTTGRSERMDESGHLWESAEFYMVDASRMDGECAYIFSMSLRFYMADNKVKVEVVEVKDETASFMLSAQKAIRDCNDAINNSRDESGRLLANIELFCSASTVGNVREALPCLGVMRNALASLSAKDRNIIILWHCDILMNFPAAKSNMELIKEVADTKEAMK